MFQAMRRIISCLADKYVGEGAFERAIRKSFLGMICTLIFFFLQDFL